MRESKVSGDFIIIYDLFLFCNDIGRVVKDYQFSHMHHKEVEFLDFEVVY
jgi:hypothetical protein